MIDVLTSGRLRGEVSLRKTSAGAPFASWRMTTTDKNGDGVLCSCISFSVTAIEAAQRLNDGDSISVSGEASLSTWNGNDGTPRRGLDVLVHGVLTAYHIGRKRRSSGPSTSAEDLGPQ